MIAFKLLFLATAALLVSGVFSDEAEQDEGHDESKLDEPDEPMVEGVTKETVESGKAAEGPSFGEQILAILKDAFRRISAALSSTMAKYIN
uniref:Secreted protein n=1 Tax=Strigamia maritima TaxID=126957 RepID=T1ITK0_STRMM